MSRIGNLLAGHMHPFRGKKHKNSYRVEQNKYLAVNMRGRRLDYGGWLETSRDTHQFLEFDTKSELIGFLQNDVAKSERKDWATYKRYEKPPTQD